MSSIGTPDSFNDSPNPISTAAIAAIALVVPVVMILVFAPIIWICCLKGKLPTIRFNTTPWTYPSPPGPPLPVFQKDVGKGETIVEFIDQIAKEKPMRFSHVELSYFTGNYSTQLGSGGFGVVYKGQFSDGTPIAVKVLNKSLDRRVEEQFMAEVGTLARYCNKILLLY